MAISLARNTFGETVSAPFNTPAERAGVPGAHNSRPARGPRPVDAPESFTVRMIYFPAPDGNGGRVRVDGPAGKRFFNVPNNSGAALDYAARAYCARFINPGAGREFATVWEGPLSVRVREGRGPARTGKAVSFYRRPVALQRAA